MQGPPRKSIGEKAPRRPVNPFRPSGTRGVPALATATFELRPRPAPLPLHASPQPLRKRPGAEKKTAVEKTAKSPVEAVESPKSFNLLGLPAELRTQIYELCVSVSNYITYDERDLCTYGAELRNEKHEEHCKVERGDPMRDPVNTSFQPTLPGCFYARSARVSKFHPTLDSFRPPILKANSQIRNEALPVFFAVNDFVFEDCEARYLKK